MTPESFNSAGGPFEPSSVARTFAATLYDNYRALTAEGFTESQALQIIGAVLANVASK